MITVVTACYGEDVVQEQHAQDLDPRWVCVSDRREMPVSHWTVVHEPRPHLTPRMAAHVVKCMPFRYAHHSSDIVVWLDASARLARSDSLRVLIAPMLDDVKVKVCTLRHPDRVGLYEEAKAARGQTRYAGQPLEEQVDHYLSSSYPDEELFATTIVAYAYSMQAIELGEHWLLEQAEWTCQDQLSLPVVAWRLGVKVATSEENLWDTPHIVLRPRARDV